MSPMEGDLVALFKLQEEAVYKLINRGVRLGWTPDELIRSVESLFEENNEGIGE